MLRRIAVMVAVTIAIVALLGVFWFRTRPMPEDQQLGQFPEKLVFVRSADDVVNGGVVFSPTTATKKLAVIWFHGWGTNFYSPSYVGIGRALADQGFTAISGNTRMHDIANVEKYVKGKRIRGGGYWGVTSEDSKDILAWLDFAQAQGFERVVLVGHSAGWASVARYASESHDPRIAGLVLASGNVRNVGGPSDKALLQEAHRLVDNGEADVLLRIPNQSFASYVSAATFLDIEDTPMQYRDFFGVHTDKPGVTQIASPILAFFGTRGDVGSDEDLQFLKASVQRHAQGKLQVDTAMIDGGDHEYLGQELQVAQVIARWAENLAATATR